MDTVRYRTLIRAVWCISVFNLDRLIFSHSAEKGMSQCVSSRASSAVPFWVAVPCEIRQ